MNKIIKIINILLIGLFIINNVQAMSLEDKYNKSDLFIKATILEHKEIKKDDLLWNVYFLDIKDTFKLKNTILQYENKPVFYIWKTDSISNLNFEYDKSKNYYFFLYSGLYDSPFVGYKPELFDENDENIIELLKKNNINQQKDKEKGEE